MALKVAYTVFIGILLATFVGVGIAAFYNGPKQPEYPSELKFSEPLEKGATISARTRELQIETDNKQTAFEKAIKNYNRNVSIFSLVAAIILLVASLTILRRVNLIADGMLLGGILTLIYSIARGFGTDDNKFRFVVVSVGLVISIILGYLKFNRPNAQRI